MATTLFNGTSRFSQDFADVIQRSLRIAQLPTVILQQHQADLKAKVTALDSLEAKFTAIGSALDGINSAAGAGSLAISSSQPLIASASLTGTPSPSSYTLQVTNVGSVSSSLSGASFPKVTNPAVEGLTAATSLSLDIDGSITTIQPADGSLNALVTAINSANVGAEASILNVGPPSAPDYRLYLRSSALGPVSIGLTDGATSLADSLSTGTLAVYTVNGVPAGGISSNSRTIELAPGLSANFQAVGSTEISVGRSATSLSNALSSFVAAFNAAVDETSLHRGKAGGDLSGDSVIYSISKTLNGLLDYKSTSTPGATSLSDLGITFNRNGKLDFDASAIDGLSSAALQTVGAFLGSPDTGGFLKAAADAIQTVDNSTDGIIQSSTNSYNNSIKQEQVRIDANQQRLEALEANLKMRMAAADAMIAALEQQVSFFNNLYEATKALNDN